MRCNARKWQKVLFDASMEAARAEGDTETADAWDVVQADDASLGQEVHYFSLDNPPEKRWQRRKLIDRATFKRRHFKRFVRAQVGKFKPFTKKAWRCRAKCKLGTPEEVADQQWVKALQNPLIERDNDGVGGDLQLYMDCGQQLQNTEERGVESALDESSADMKKLSEKDKAALMDTGDVERWQILARSVGWWRQKVNQS